MLKRYLGGKKELIEDIINVVQDCVKSGSTVGDFFSGSTVVSQALKSHGYRVVSNDVNYFSTMFAKAYVQNCTLPKVELQKLISKDLSEKYLKLGKIKSSELKGKLGFSFLKDDSNFLQFSEFVSLLCFLEEVDDYIIADFARTDIYDHYCEEGKYSSFKSNRGSEGNRRFFTPANAKKIDLILSYIRYWYTHKTLDANTYFILVSHLIRACEKVSNTQGTYHDFPRDKYDSRALNSLKFEVFEFDLVINENLNHVVGESLDSIVFSKDTPSLDLLYLDPPYNFRQYTSYYFFPNILARYCEIEDLDNYFSNVSYVRGQNMDDNFDSQFCKKKIFINSLEEMIVNSKPNYVVLSYFNGKNHWNDFNSDCNGQGISELERFFNSNIFVKSSLKIIPVQRLNYQSYGGFKAKNINEYLFVAKLNKGNNDALA